MQFFGRGIAREEHFEPYRRVHQTARAGLGKLGLRETETGPDEPQDASLWHDETEDRSLRRLEEGDKLDVHSSATLLLLRWSVQMQLVLLPKFAALQQPSPAANRHRR